MFNLFNLIFMYTHVIIMHIIMLTQVQSCTLELEMYGVQQRELFSNSARQEPEFKDTQTVKTGEKKTRQCFSKHLPSFARGHSPLTFFLCCCANSQY